MSDFIVAPGEIIKEYLDARGLTQKEVSKRTGVGGVAYKHLMLPTNREGEYKVEAGLATRRSGTKCGNDADGG